VEARLIDSRIENTHDKGFDPGTSAVFTWEYETRSGDAVAVDMFTVMYPRGVTYRGTDYLFHGFDVHLSRHVDGTHPDPRDDVTFDCSLGIAENCLLGAPLPWKDRFEVSVRTSWLINNGAGLSGLEPALRHGDWVSGDRWTFSAREGLMSIPQQGQFGNDAAPSKGWQPYLHFQMAHAGQGLQDSAFDPRCARFGAPWQSGLTWGAGRLHWVKSKSTLDFEIHAPHLDPHGKPLLGDFTAEIPLAWLRCFAGKRLNPSYFTLSVVDEDGAEQVAATSLKVRQGTVHVRATGFHFSSPTIQLSTVKKRR